MLVSQLTLVSFGLLFVSINCVQDFFPDGAFLSQDADNPSISGPNPYYYYRSTEPKPFISKLNDTCDPTLFKSHSKFHLLNQKTIDGKIKDQKSLQAVLKEIRAVVDSTSAEDIAKTCVIKGQKPELLECIDGLCTCYKTGIWGALQLQIDNGSCVSPNGAWCINWGNDNNMILSKCAGGGWCKTPKHKLPFLCADLEMGVCEGGRGEVANTKLSEEPKCFQAKGPRTLGSIMSLVMIMAFTQTYRWFLHDVY